MPIAVNRNRERVRCPLSRVTVHVLVASSQCAAVTVLQNCMSRRRSNLSSPEQGKEATMSATTRARRFWTFALFAVGLAALDILTAPPALAAGEPYLGWDFGNGFGIGVGTPPSAYDPCPTYGWP